MALCTTPDTALSALWPFFGSPSLAFYSQVNHNRGADSPLAYSGIPFSLFTPSVHTASASIRRSGRFLTPHCSFRTFFYHFVILRRLPSWLRTSAFPQPIPSSRGASMAAPFKVPTTTSLHWHTLSYSSLSTYTPPHLSTSPIASYHSLTLFSGSHHCSTSWNHFLI